VKPSPAAQIRAVRSLLEVITSFPSWLNATPSTGAEWAIRNSCGTPVSVFHSRAVESVPAVAK